MTAAPHADSATSAADKAAAEKCLQGYEELEAASEPHACEGVKDGDDTCPVGCEGRLELLWAHCGSDLLGENILDHMEDCGIDPANPDLELEFDVLSVALEAKIAGMFLF
jgi:hypothetical protein